jgi:hypothetical protein
LARRLGTKSAVLLLLAWGCGGSSNDFSELPEESAGKGGSGQGGSSRGGSAGTGGASGGTGGASGGTGGSATGGASGRGGGSGGLTGGSAGATGGVGGAQGGDAGSGAAGAGQGGTTGGSSAGLAGGGQSGGGGAGTACSDPDVGAGLGDGTRKQGTAVGTNGSFTDACDESGNLVEHSCELAPCISARVAVPFGGTSGAGGISACPTGRVVSTTIDCGGHCEDGACFGWCAEQGGQFEVTSVDGTNLTMTKGDDEYSCAVVFQREGYDCLGQALVGRTLVVTSLGSCTGASTTWGWDDPESAMIQECTFTCTLK